MRTTLKFLIPVLAAAGALAGCGSSSKTTSATSPATTQPASAATSGQSSSAVVKTAANAKLGRTILVDAHGMTLYSLSGERGGKFICAGSPCTQVWHPLTGSAANASVSSLGTVKRPDGTQQVTYQGMPLYSFAQDRAPGEANGQGIKDVGTWSALTASPSAATSSPPATTSTSKSGGVYGY